VDVHIPPVPGGESMPPLEDWIPVGNPVATVPDITIPDGTANIIPSTPVQPFIPEDIPVIITSPGFKPKPSNPDAEIIITWPGTDIPVGGTLVPADNPKVFAPVIIKVYEEVQKAANILQSKGSVSTPFSPDPPQEIQALTQQIIWIYATTLSGETYDKKIFADKVYSQFQDNTGTKVNALPKDQKDAMDEGIEDFWTTFAAVGVEAKVLMKNEK
jgi:hypothetical protein